MRFDSWMRESCAGKQAKMRVSTLCSYLSPTATQATEANNDVWVASDKSLGRQVYNARVNEG